MLLLFNDEEIRTHIMYKKTVGKMDRASCLPGQADEAKLAGRAGTGGKGGPVQKG
jgi:hypothetical protein